MSDAIISNRCDSGLVNCKRESIHKRPVRKELSHCGEQRKARYEMQSDVEEIAIEFKLDNQKGSIGSAIYTVIKRLFDVLASLGILILLFPILLIIAASVYLGDPGPVIYGQIRIGKDGKPFKMWKFRSMYKNSEEMIKKLTPEQIHQYYTEFKIDNDPRITKVGNFLRKTSLDELPQLFNVLFNDMSLIGPRPLIESEIQMNYADTYQEIGRAHV